MIESTKLDGNSGDVDGHIVDGVERLVLRRPQNGALTNNDTQRCLTGREQLRQVTGPCVMVLERV